MMYVALFSGTALSGIVKNLLSALSDMEKESDEAVSHTQTSRTTSYL